MQPVATHTAKAPDVSTSKSLLGLNVMNGTPECSR